MTIKPRRRKIKGINKKIMIKDYSNLKKDIKIGKPTTENYSGIADISNRADKDFFKIYNKEQAKEIGLGRETIEDLIKGEETREYLCLWADNKIVSFVSFRLKNPQTIWVSHICTDPDYQGMGYGAKLMERVENIAKERNASVVVLETESQADWAVNFYLKNNYKILLEEDLKIFPFNKVLDKPPVKNRYILGKIV